MHRLILALVAIMALTLAACSSPGSSPSSSEASVEPSSATEAASPSEEASASADASSSEIALPSIDLPSSAPELEDALPDSVGDITLQKFSMRGAEFLAQGGDDQEFQDFLERLDAQPEDVSVAFAFGADTTDGSAVSVFAFRVEGASTDDLTRELQGSLESDGSAADLSESNIGGKDVLVGESTDETTPGSVYLYGVGDIVFFIGASDEAQATEILSTLP
ncbi:MAG: hypothetical protein ABI534_08655 [Chloroflexota bacterium]